jgi:predicted phage-related endonuclease
MYFTESKEAGKDTVRLLESILELQKKEKAIKAEISEKKVKLFDEMKKSGVQNFSEFGKVISVIEAGMRTGVNTAKLKSKFPDIYEQCQKLSSIKESLRISDKKD